MSINRVEISGNLTRDAELRQTASGMPILTFGVAVNDRRKNPQTGEWEDYANYVDCTMFGNRAQGIAQYLTKGAKVFLAGKLRWSQWDDANGSKRSKLEVVVDDEIEWSRNQGQQQYQAPQYHAAQTMQPQYQAQPAPLPMQPQYQAPPAQLPMQQQMYSEDIPF